MMQLEQDKALTQFYKELQEWIDAGEPAHEAFSGSFGLCGNLDFWMQYLQPNLNGLSVQIELQEQFILASLGRFYPFSTKEEYQIEVCQSLCFKNSNRLKWVKDHAS